MLFFFSTKRFIERLKIAMSQWSDDIIAKIANGIGTDPATKAAVAELKTKVTALESTNATLQAAIDANDGFDSALAAKVTALETADAEHETAMSAIVAALQKGDTEGALAIATDAQG